MTNSLIPAASACLSKTASPLPRSQGDALDHAVIGPRLLLAAIGVPVMLMPRSPAVQEARR